MGCRRKTKSERELIADIKKTFERYCESVGECRNCMYYDKLGCTLEDCISLYILDLSRKAAEILASEDQCKDCSTGDICPVKKVRKLKEEK